MKEGVFGGVKDFGLVSIITPSYNTCEYIIETIKSVQAQTYSNWEMIIVDDCSDDCTIEIVENYIKESKEQRIRILQNPRNSGAAISRNYALREAQGRWIAFLDSDDLWMPDKLEKQILFMAENQYWFTYTNYCEMGMDSKPLGRIVTGPKHITRKGMYRYCWPGCLTVMFDADKIGLIQIKNIQKNNDYAMWLQACKKSDCYLLDFVLARYRRREGSISNHKLFKLVKWHYMLFRDVEGLNSVIASVYTMRNLLFGFIKKAVYVKRADSCRS